MTNQEWQSKINRCRSAYARYKILLGECEREYEDRFGVNPSDVDDDFWIDTMHLGIGSSNVDKIIESAKTRRDYDTN